MQSALLIAYITAVLNGLIAMIVLARGLRRLQNVIFVILVVFIAFWSVATGVSNATRDIATSELFSRFSYGASVPIIGLSYLLSVLMGPRKIDIVKQLRWKVVAAMAILTPLCSTSLLYNATTIDTFSYGPMIVPYYIFVVAGILLTSYELRLTLRKGSTIQRQQARLVVGGLTLTMVLIGITNLVLPLVSDSELSTVYSPLFSIIFVATVGTAITRHKFFDIRAVVARSFAYIFVTLFIVSAYVIFAFALKRVLFPELNVTSTQLISNMLLTIILVLTYQPIKRFFDKTTNRLFFRDAYDPQALLDDLNKTLVTQVELEKLLRDSAHVIEQNLKSSFCSFVIEDTAYFGNRMVGDYQSKLNSEEMRSMHDLLIASNMKIIHAEEVDTNSENISKLVKLMKTNNVELIVRLVDGSHNKQAGVGYLLLGPKRSGNLYTNQDIKLLEIIANELIIAVENALRFEEIEQFSLTLQKKIADATKELRKSNEKLKALDEAKDEFISMASHQLRTPLTSVKGYLSMLAEGDAGKLNATQKQFIDQAFVSSQRMVYLIADLLNVSRLKTGKFIIESAPTYLPDVVESEIAQLHETVKSRGLTMTFNKPTEFSTLSLDETKIRQVVMNFTDNAIYYTPSGGTIELKLVDTPTSVEFTVTDTGLGVPKTDQPHLFTKFYRAGNARKARPDGTGLGLFMAKKVIVAQGGSLIFKSAENKGSTFGFRFPKEKLLVK